MLPKPDSCKGCPLYGNGMGFVPDDIVPGSEVFVILQNPGDNEEQEGRPAIGPSGDYLNNHFFPLAGLSREMVSVGNVLKCRWHNPKKGEKTNDLPSSVGVWNEEKGKWDKAKGKAIEQAATVQCMSAHLRVPKHTKLIVTLGALGAKAIAGVDNVTEWRGFMAETPYEGVDVFMSYHPAYLLQTPRMSIPAMMDWKKIGMYLKGTWPKPIPFRSIVDTTAALSQIDAPVDTSYLTYDLEYDPSTSTPFLAGIAWFNAQGEVLGGVQIWTQAVDQDVLRSWFLSQFEWYPVVMHNCVADMEVSQKAWNITANHYSEIHDTIQLHAVAHSEWPHDLAFCESLYGRHKRLKHLFNEDVLLYNWGDCLTTGYTYHQLQQMKTTDSLSYAVYEKENMPVVPIRLESKIKGIRLDTNFLSRMSDELAHRAQAAQRIADMYAGINVGSHLQVTTFLQKVEGMKLPKNRDTGNVQIDKDIVAELRRNFLDYDPEEEKDGITEDQLLANIAAGGHPILEARACYQNSAVLRSHFITTLLKPGVSDNKLHYEPDEFVDRCYPDQHTHTQASGRWSTVEPPLPTLQKKLRKMVIPDEGYAICGFDFDQQELRIDAHLSNDTPTIDAFILGYDIHTINTCDVFNYPYPTDLKDPHTAEVNLKWREDLKWEGKDDRRRVFNKRFVYRIRYRGNPKYAGDIPGAKVLGLTAKDLVEASRNYLSRHPNVVKYWQRVDANVLKTRTTRTPEAEWNNMFLGGRKRYLNGYGVKSRIGEVPPICREGTNHPMQGFGADALYITVQEIYRSTRDLHVRWGYGAHDSQKWLVPVQNVPIFQARIPQIMGSPWKVNGKDLYLPITMDKPTYAPEEVTV